MSDQFPWTIRALGEWLSGRPASEIYARGEWLLSQLSPGDFVVARGFPNEPVLVVGEGAGTLYTTDGPGYGNAPWSVLDIGSDLAKYEPQEVTNESNDSA